MESPPPSAPQSPNASAIRSYKLVWRLFAAANLALGAYMFAGARKKDAGMANGEGKQTPKEDGKPVEEPPATEEPLKFREPIPPDQMLELFKWMLEEKRKVKPKDPEEKKRIDEEKAILKQFIKTKTVPNLKY